MSFKYIVILIMLIIMLALGRSLIFLIRDKGDGKRTVKALSWRIGLSLGLFLFLFLAFSLGWIQPHGF